MSLRFAMLAEITIVGIQQLDSHNFILLLYTAIIQIIDQNAGRIVLEDFFGWTMILAV